MKKRANLRASLSYWTILCLSGLLYVIPTLSTSSIQQPYTPSTPSTYNLSSRVRYLLTKNNIRDTDITQYYPYTSHKIGVICGVIMMVLTAFFPCWTIVSLWRTFKHNTPFEIAYLSSNLFFLGAVWLTKYAYGKAYNPGGIFLTHQEILIIDPGYSITAKSIPYEDIKGITKIIQQQHGISDEVGFEIEVAPGYTLCERRGIPYQGKSSVVVVSAYLIEGYYDIYHRLINKISDIRLSVIREKALIDQQAAEAQYLNQIKEDNVQPYIPQVQEPIPHLLQEKIAHIQQSQEGLFHQIEGYYPEKIGSASWPFFKSIGLFSLNIATLLVWFAHNPPDWAILCCVLVNFATLPIALLLVIISYLNYVANKHPGGWFITDTGLLIIENNAELKYKFFPYTMMKNILKDTTTTESIWIKNYTTPMHSIKLSAMGTEVSQMLYEHLHAKLAAIKIEAQQKQIQAQKGNENGYPSKEHKTSLAMR